MERGVRAAAASNIQPTASARFEVTRPTHPCEWRVSMRDRSTSAMMPAPPEISSAFGWAPDIPPRPDETKVRPRRSASSGTPRYSRPAFSRVM